MANKLDRSLYYSYMVTSLKAGERGGHVGHNVPGPGFARGPALPDVAISVSG